jgi:8-oxo-dGTP pyrophosphatase MutT (NUDIX family)
VRPPEALAGLARALLRGGRPSSDFDLDGGAAGAARGLRPAAVLLAVDLSGERAAVILTKRAAHLRHHPGQIALPGGKVDAGDASPEACALREAREEVSLTGAEVLGTLPPHETVTGFSVTPVLAALREPRTLVPEASEVAEAFRVPLAHLADPGSYRVEGRLWGGRRRSYLVAPWGPYYVWGATARILHSLALGMRT